MRSTEVPRATGAATAVASTLGLLAQCRGLVLAVAAAWHWDPADELPNGQRAERELVGALRSGPPWPALNTVMCRAGIP